MNKQLNKVYNFQQPLLRYRFLIYMRQVTCIPAIYADCSMDLYYEFLDTVVTVPLMLTTDYTCDGNTTDNWVVPPQGSLLGKAVAMKQFQIFTRDTHGLSDWSREHDQLNVKLRANGIAIAEADCNLRQIALEKSIMRSASVPFRQGALGFMYLDHAIGVTGGDVFESMYTDCVDFQKYLHLPPRSFTVPEPIPDAWMELLVTDVDPEISKLIKKKKPKLDSLSRRMLERVHAFEDEQQEKHFTTSLQKQQIKHRRNLISDYTDDGRKSTREVRKKMRSKEIVVGILDF